MSPFDAIRTHRLVPVIEIRDAGLAPDLAAALVAGGLPIIEITMRTEAAGAALRNVANAGGSIMLAAGTVTSPDLVDLAVDSGAELIISPGLNRLVVEHCLKKNIPVLPGVCTPSEIETARNYGLRAVKFFPAEAYGGVRTLRALNDVYRGFSFVPTGGINAQNVVAYLTVPTVIACGGSFMAPAAMIVNREFDAITALVKEAVSLVAEGLVQG